MIEPSFFGQFDRETEIVWDLSTRRLKGMRRWVTVDSLMTHSIAVVSLGEPFRAGDYPGFFVPYEVRVGTAGSPDVTKKHRLALRNDNPQRRWSLDGGW